MLKGRLFVGMARGYQARWQNILCQRFGVTSTASDQASADQRNRLLFSENFKIMKKAWANDLLTLQRARPTRCRTRTTRASRTGRRPRRSRPLRRAGRGRRRTARCEGSASCRSRTRQPAPAAVPGVRREPGTLQWCGEEDVTPTILMGPIEMLQAADRDLPEGAALERAATRAFGEGIGVCRTFYVYPNGTRRTVDAQICAERRDKYEEPVWRGWYQPFGFMEASRLLGEEGPVPKPGEHLAERLMNSGLLIGGTVDDVKRQIETFLQELPIDYFVWLFHWGMIAARRKRRCWSSSPPRSCRSSGWTRTHLARESRCRSPHRSTTRGEAGPGVSPPLALTKGLVVTKAPTSRPPSADRRRGRSPS